MKRKNIKNPTRLSEVFKKKKKNQFSRISKSALSGVLYGLNFSITLSYWLLSFIFNFLLFAFVATLETYTVCFIRNNKK